MNKKRLLGVIALTILVVMSMTLLASCGGTDVNSVKSELGKEYFGESFTPVDYSGMEKQNRLNAFDVLMEAYNNWIVDTGYRREQYFTFEAEAPAKHITNFCQDVYKIDGDRLYRRMVVVQDSKPFQDNRNDVTRFYYDGKNAKRGYVNDKAVVPGNPEDMFKALSEPAMEDYTGKGEESVEARLKTYKTHLTTYIWNDEKNWSKKGSKKVYKAEDGTLRFTMTIDCSKKAMDTVHMAARDEFLASTGAQEGTLEMREDTTIDFVVKEVPAEGNKTTYKFVAWRRTEQYQGKAMGFVAIPAKQTCIEVFSYDEADYTITAEDIA